MRGFSPDLIVNTSDTGDSTQRRFRYQAAYAAIVSLDMFAENCTYEELFCEQYEDILVKLKSGSYIGTQVKTRIKLGTFSSH